MAEQQIPFQFPPGRSLNNILYGQQPTDLPSLVTGQPSYTTPEQYTEQRNVAVLTALQGYNIQLGENKFDIAAIGRKYDIPQAHIQQAYDNALRIHQTSGKGMDTFVNTVSKVAVGIIGAVWAGLGALFVGPTGAGLYGDAAAAGTEGAGAPATINTDYFGFEESTMQTLGVSPYQGGEQSLTPAASSSLAGAPAPALSLPSWLSSGLAGLSTIMQKVSDFFLKGAIGTTENAAISAVKGEPSFVVPGGLATQPAQVRYLPGGGGGGLGYNPNGDVSATGNGWLVFVGVFVAVILFVLYLRKRG